jgi:hypothetical protein
VKTAAVTGLVSPVFVILPAAATVLKATMNNAKKIPTVPIIKFVLPVPVWRPTVIKTANVRHLNFAVIVYAYLLFAGMELKNFQKLATTAILLMETAAALHVL